MGIYEDINTIAIHAVKTYDGNKLENMVGKRVIEWLDSPSCPLVPDYESDEDYYITTGGVKDGI